MTTLHVREEVLRDATAPYSSVDDLQVQADFPHTLPIQVIERRPVAALAGAGERRIPVTGNGTLLRGVTAERDLPSVKLERRPAGARVTDRRLLSALAVASAAPAALRGRTDEVKVDKRGVIVDLEDGPELIFGGGEEAGRNGPRRPASWPRSPARGATYLDLRIPGRVAAGGLAPIEPEPTPDPNPLPEAENSLTLNP